MIEDNSLCKLLGIKYPIIQADMGGGNTTHDLFYYVLKEVKSEILV